MKRDEVFWVGERVRICSVKHGLVKLCTSNYMELPNIVFVIDLCK